jgi:flagellar biosynthesis protein
LAEPDEKKEIKKQQKAIAVAYEPATREAPHVLASGRGVVAEQILKVAFAHGIKVREDADLVELLGHLDVDSEIPLEAFAAVAEILSYVYRANGQMPPTSLSPSTNGTGTP